ncbi:MAG: SAVED domain-containing protein, partial [Candidatus Cloacimonetes bacterium]|nr:SAVED domain-containing protein [Candidatus Cloacimonadota bacterium]
QIVFGCTQAHDNLKDAIDDVLKQACDIKDNRHEEVHLLDPSILNTIMEPSATAYIKNIVTPNRSSTIDTDDAFGLFMTYSINVPGKDTMSNAAYRVALDTQMDTDIKANLPYIFSQIKSLGLAAYSFYFFILPLDKVEDDTKAIMSMSVGGGD